MNRRTTIHALLALACAFGLTLGPAPLSAAPRVPDDTYFDEQWYLRHIGAPEAWNSSLGFEGVTIAFIDSGVDVDHPDLKDNIWRNPGEIAGNGIDDDRNGYVDDVRGWDFVDGDADPRPAVDGDSAGIGVHHGTIGAGIAAGRGDNGKGIVGVTWQSTIMPLRVLDSSGSGDPYRIVRAIDYAVANGAKVINLSFAGPSRNELLATALRRAYDRGVFVVAAAGNAPDGGEAVDLDVRPLYPVCLDAGADENFIYGVAATDDRDIRAPFSNYGAGCIDASAPGTRILSTQFYRPADPRFSQAYGGYYNGTSLAAPIVAGTVALIRAMDPNLTPKQIMNIFTETSVNVDALNPSYFGKLGRGRIDAAKAVARSLVRRSDGPAPVPTASFLPPGAPPSLVVAAPGPGRAPEIRLFTKDGLFIRGFEAFPGGFRGGVSVATGNFDGSVRQSIVAGAMAGGTPHVRIFDINTRPIGGFLAFDDLFRGGVSVAVGDLDGDGRDEIVAGAGPGGGPHVRMFTPQGVPIGGFFAFDASHRGGVSVAVGDLDGDGRDEIVAMTASGSAVRVFDARGTLLSSFSPPLAKPGASLALADADGDGEDEIVVVRADETVVFSPSGTPVARFGPEGLDRAYAAAQGIAAAPVPADLIVGSPAGGPPSFGVLGAAAHRYQAFDRAFAGGVNVAVTE